MIPKFALLTRVLEHDFFELEGSTVATSLNTCCARLELRLERTRWDESAAFRSRMMHMLRHHLRLRRIHHMPRIRVRFDWVGVLLVRLGMLKRLFVHTHKRSKAFVATVVSWHCLLDRIATRIHLLIRRIGRQPGLPHPTKEIHVCCVPSPLGFKWHCAGQHIRWILGKWLEASSAHVHKLLVLMMRVQILVMRMYFRRVWLVLRL